MYAMRPMWGGIRSNATQITRISVMSVSKYSANPAHTPAIFLPARMRRSRLGDAVADAASGSDDAEPVWPASLEEATPVGLPHEIQYRAESSRCAPHCVQYMLPIQLKHG